GYEPRMAPRENHDLPLRHPRPALARPGSAGGRGRRRRLAVADGVGPRRRVRRRHARPRRARARLHPLRGPRPAAVARTRVGRGLRADVRPAGVVRVVVVRPRARARRGGAARTRWERVRRLVNDAVRLRGPDHRDDQAGVILFGRRPKLVLPPAAVDRLPIDERLAGPIDGQYTDVAAALKLALASFPEGTGKRIVL